MKLSTAIKELLTLSLPIIMGQLGLMLIGAGDVYIASIYSTKSVAAIGVANSCINPLFLFGIGLMMGISPSLSIKRGAGEKSENKLSSVLFYGLVIGLFLTLVTLIWNISIPKIGIDENLIDSVTSYNKVVAWSFPFAIMFQAMKEYLQAFEKVFFANFIAIVGVFINLALNYFLVFGIDTYSGIGEIGLAYASFAIRFFLFLSLLIYLLKKEGVSKIDKHFSWFTFKFSLPIAIMFLFEVSAFCLVGILGGHLGVVAAATNNIALTMASIAFMIPMSISNAASVKVGHAFGMKSMSLILKNIKASLLVGVTYVFFSSSIFFLFPNFLMSLSSKDPEVIALGVSLLFIVAIFQFVDSIQVILNGILRGLERVKIPSIYVLIGFWGIGIPIGIYLAFSLNYGISGLWIGLAIALSATALGLTFYLTRELKKELFN